MYVFIFYDLHNSGNSSMGCVCACVVHAYFFISSRIQRVACFRFYYNFNFIFLFAILLEFEME